MMFFYFQKDHKADRENDETKFIILSVDKAAFPEIEKKNLKT